MEAHSSQKGYVTPLFITSSVLCYKTQLISIPIRIHSRIFLTRHAVTALHCFAHFQKWKSAGLVWNIQNVAEGAANEVKKKNNKPKISYLLNILPIWCLPCSRSISYKIHFFFVLFSFTLMHCLWLKRKILFVLVFQFILIIQLCLFSFERVDYILHGEFFVLWVFPVRGALPFLALSRACFSGNPLKDCKGLI